MENIDKIIDEEITDKPDTQDQDGVVEQEQPKPIEKPKKPRTQAQKDAWARCLEKRKAMCKTINKVKDEEKETIRKKKAEAVEQLLRPKETKPEPEVVEEEDEEDLELSEDTEEEDEEVVVVKRKPKALLRPKAKPKAKPKPKKKKVVYVSDDDTEDEDYTEESEDDSEPEVERPRRQIKKTKTTPPKEEKPADPYEGMDFRTKMRMRGF